MSWRSADAELADFAERNRWLSTSTASGFVRVASVQRRDATGVDILRRLVLSRVGEGTAPTDPLTARDDWLDALTEVFARRVDRMPTEQLDALGDHLLRSHHARVEAGQP